jgi:aldehyde:ferredoxin oxidoreductase
LRRSQEFAARTACLCGTTAKLSAEAWLKDPLNDYRPKFGLEAGEIFLKNQLKGKALGFRCNICPVPFCGEVFAVRSRCDEYTGVHKWGKNLGLLEREERKKEWR